MASRRLAMPPAATLVAFAGLIRRGGRGRDRMRCAVFVMLSVVALASIREMMRMFASSRTSGVTTPPVAMIAAVATLRKPGSFRRAATPDVVSIAAQPPA